MKKLRIFSAIQFFNWECENLVKPLRDMGHEVINWDFRGDGYNQYSHDWETCKKKEMNDELLKRVSKAHAEKQLDLFFGYLSDPVISVDSMMELKSYQIPLVNFSCNDVNSFERGLSRISPFFDLTWTTNRKALKNYQSVNAKAKFIPFGVNPNFYKLLDYKELPKFAYDVSFIGQPYGYRLPMIITLINKGLSYGIFGKTSYKRLIRTILETRVCLNFLGLPEADFNNHEMKQLRLRDFEVTALGGLLLTERIPEIQELFEDRKEVLMYNSVDEFIDLAIYYSRYKNRKERLEISRAGKKKCLNEYTWDNHFNTIFREMKLA